MEDRDTAACLAKINGRNTLITSVYLDQTNKDVISEKLIDIISYANSHSLPILLGIDTNCHSTFFGLETNPRGAILKDFIIEHSLKIENTGTTPTFQSSHYSSCIDVTLSRDIGNAVTDWVVSEEFNGSDHNTISFKIRSHMIEIEPSRDWENCDWSLFSKELSCATFFRPERVTDCKVDKLLGKLYKVINKTLDKACPLSKV